MTKHTPGPWMYLSGGRITTSAGSDWPKHSVCTVRQLQTTSDANARLIAAAPDLLAALQYWFDSRAIPSEIAAKARAAIAKATGDLSWANSSPPSSSPSCRSQWGSARS